MTTSLCLNFQVFLPFKSFIEIKIDIECRLNCFDIFDDDCMKA